MEEQFDFDYYGEKKCQIKVGERDKLHYTPGNDIDIPDGIYVCYEGLIVIHNGIFVCEMDNLYTKWGDILDKYEILERIRKYDSVEENVTNTT